MPVSSPVRGSITFFCAAVLVPLLSLLSFLAIEVAGFSAYLSSRQSVLDLSLKEAAYLVADPQQAEIYIRERVKLNQEEQLEMNALDSKLNITLHGRYNLRFLQLISSSTTMPYQLFSEVELEQVQYHVLLNNNADSYSSIASISENSQCFNSEFNVLKQIAIELLGYAGDIQSAGYLYLYNPLPSGGKVDDLSEFYNKNCLIAALKKDEMEFVFPFDIGQDFWNPYTQSLKAEFDQYIDPLYKIWAIALQHSLNQANISLFSMHILQQILNEQQRTSGNLFHKIIILSNRFPEQSISLRFNKGKYAFYYIIVNQSFSGFRYEKVKPTEHYFYLNNNTAALNKIIQKIIYDQYETRLSR